jgi:excisionase family DNA binding protein
MTEIDLSTWLPMAEAMAAIGVSKRTVERLAARKQLEQRLRPQDGSPPVAVYSPESVAEEAARRRQTPAPFVLGTVPAGNGNGTGRPVGHIESTPDPSGIQLRSGDDPIRLLFAAALKAVLSPPSPPVAETVTETPLLTVDETATFLRVRVSRVRALIRRGTLTPVKLSRRTADWRIRRKDLEQL